MKQLLFLVIIAFTFQKYILFNYLNSCDDKVNHGDIIPVNVCLGNSIYKHSVDFTFTRFYECNSNCSFCRFNQTERYGCRKLESLETFVEAYYGEPKPLKPTGFYMRPCENKKNIREVFRYFPESYCRNNKNISSIKTEYNQDRNMLIYEEFHGRDCKNFRFREYYPLERCIKLPSERDFLILTRELK